MTKEIEVRLRISKVMEDKNLNAHFLSNKNAALAQKLFNQLYKGKTLTFSTIEVILNAIPDLNTEWLFRGIGSPFKDMTSPEQRLNDIEERLSALEGERETDTHQAQQHTA